MFSGHLLTQECGLVVGCGDLEIIGVTCNIAVCLDQGKLDESLGTQPLIRIVRKLYNGGMFEVLYLIALRMFESAYREIQETFIWYEMLHGTVSNYFQCLELQGKTTAWCGMQRWGKLMFVCCWTFFTLFCNKTKILTCSNQWTNMNVFASWGRIIDGLPLSRH